MNQDRLKAVKSLIELSQPLDSVAERIRAFNWDYDGKPVELRPHHLVKVLTAYLDGTLSAADVEQWANLVEGREDISFDSPFEKWIDEVVHELANPAIAGTLDKVRAKAIVASSPVSKT